MTGDEARVLVRIEARATTTMEETRSAIRQRSVSQTGEAIQAMADWVQAYLQAMGARARPVSGLHAPIVEGELGADPRRLTLLLYEHYDTQPAAGQPGWNTDPFAARIVPGAGGCSRLVGRSAFNSKGPLVAALVAMPAFAEAGIALPVNIRFLVEGEEEIGSPSLPDYIALNRADLAACDAALIPYFDTTATGDKLLRLGFKGLVLLEFCVTGGARGGPARSDRQAWHGAVVGSPRQLVRALSMLIDERERLCVDGPADLLPPPGADEAALIEAASKDYDLDAYRDEIGVEQLNQVRTECEALHALSFACTLNIDALARRHAAGRRQPCDTGAADRARVRRPASAAGDDVAADGRSVAPTSGAARVWPCRGHRPLRLPGLDDLGSRAGDQGFDRRRVCRPKRPSCACF